MHNSIARSSFHTQPSLPVICFPAHKWFFVAKGGNILANAAGSINHVHGKGVSFVDYGWEKVAAQKLAA